MNKFTPKSDEGIFLSYSTNKVAYKVLIRRTRLIVESFNVKFDDCYVRNTDPTSETKAILESDIASSSDSLNIVELNYDDLFDPIETAQLSEVLVSPEAQQQHAEVLVLLYPMKCHSILPLYQLKEKYQLHIR